MTIFRLFQMHAKRWLVSHRAAPRDDQVVAEHRDQHIDPEGNHDHDVHGQKISLSNDSIANLLAFAD